MSTSIDVGPATRVLTSDGEAIEAAHRFAAQVAAGASERDRRGQPPVAELDALSATGLYGITVPRSLGGAGVTFTTAIEVFRILSAADANIGQLPHNHFVFVEALKEDGTPAQQYLLLGEVLAGARFGNAQAERGTASGLDVRTRVVPDGRGGWRLNGTKYYCTGALVAHWIPVAAIDEHERQVIAYIRRDAPGVEVVADWNGMGQRGTASGTVTLTDVEVRPEQLVAHWRLFGRPSLFHAYGQALHAAIDVGIAADALRDTLALLRSRTRPRFGAAVDRAGEDPLVLHRLGQLSARLHASEALLARAGAALDDAAGDLDAASEASAAAAGAETKAYAEDVVMEITNDLFALGGSASVDDGLNLHRHWRNARTHTVHDANQWRYHVAGDHLLNGTPPRKTARRAAPNAISKNGIGRA